MIRIVWLTKKLHCSTKSIILNLFMVNVVIQMMFYIINASINYENYNIIILGNILKFRLIK